LLLRSFACGTAGNPRFAPNAGRPVPVACSLWNKDIRDKGEEVARVDRGVGEA